MCRPKEKNYCLLIFLIPPFIAALYTSPITADNTNKKASHISSITIKSQFEARFLTAMKILGAFGGGIIGFGIADIVMDRPVGRSAIDITINGPWLDRLICLTCIGIGASGGSRGTQLLLNLLDINNDEYTTNSTGSSTPHPTSFKDTIC